MEKNASQNSQGTVDIGSTYLRAEVETAEPLKLLILLYNRMIRELRELRDKMDSAEASPGGVLPPELDARFERCRNILSYLTNTINPEAGEISEKLDLFYRYLFGKILQAHMEKDSRIIDEILPNLETVRDGWTEIYSREG